MTTDNTTKLPEDVLARFNERFTFGGITGTACLDPRTFDEDDPRPFQQFLAQELSLQAQAHAESKLLELAEAQLLGFVHARQNRDDLEGLIESMGLTKTEWEKMQPMFDMAYLTDEDRKEIEQALKDTEQEKHES